MKITDISTYRTPLMGVAALWVLLFHAQVSLCGWGGVEIFIFLSAIGCYHSLDKQGRKITSFYKKRIVRIFLPYLIILLGVHLCSMVVGHLVPSSQQSLNYPHGMWEAICFYTTLGFWIPGKESCCYDWYVPCILFFYLLMPSIKRISDGMHQKIKLNALACIIVAIVVALPIEWGIYKGLNSMGIDDYRYVLSYNRLAILFAGFLLAPYVLGNLQTKGGRLICGGAILAIAVLRIYFSPHCGAHRLTVENLLMYFATSGICMLLVYVFKMKAFYMIFSFIGERSLEVYLIHMFLIKLLWGAKHFIDVPTILLIILLLLLTFALSELVHRMVRLISLQIHI